MKLSDKVIEEFYSAVAGNNNHFIYSLHIPLSDVFYTREAVSNKFGKRFTLDYIEWAMLKEGMISPRHCYQPELKMSWDEYPLDKEVK